MSGLSALTLDSSQLAASQPSVLRLFFSVTSGAVTHLLSRDLPPVVFGVASGDFTQAAVNKLLEKDSSGADLSASSTAEVDVATAFGATAMGVDAFGFVIQFRGQVARCAGAMAYLFPGTEDVKFTPQTATLPNTLTQGLLVTPAGNLAGRVIPTGLDSATGQLVIEIYFWSK